GGGGGGGGGGAGAAGAGGDGVFCLAFPPMGHGGGVEAGADIAPPQLVQGLVVIGENGAVDHGGDDEAAGGGEYAGRVRIGQVDALLHDAGTGIEHHEAAGDDALRAGPAAPESAL